jgi:hypothetical protein
VILPHYGAETLARPLVANIPVAPPQAEPSACPYCGAACWVMSLEATIGRLLPPGTTYTSACTACALRRARHQMVMDAARWRRENAEVCDLARTVESDHSGGQRGL